MPFDAATPAEPAPMPPREPGSVRAIVLYDPINPSDRTIADLEWRQDKTLTEYLDGLPEDTSWIVNAGGRLVERDEWHQITLLETDAIIVAARPEKGGGQILAIVAMIAIAVAAPYIGAAIAGAGTLAATAISAGITVLGGMLVSTLLTQPTKTPDRQIQDSSSSPSYGLDGPKNTATQDTPVPVLYGQFRTGGNRVNYHSETSADGLSQTLYMQYVVSEGPIEEITGFEINGQPIGNFADVEIKTALGTNDQQPCPWFEATTTPYFVGSTLTTSPTFYNTVDEVDRVKLDVTFPNGLYTVDRNNGNRSARAVSFAATAQPINSAGTPTGAAFPIAGSEIWVPVTAGSGGAITVQGSRLRVTVRAPGADGVSPTTPFSIHTQVTSSSGTHLDDIQTGTIANLYRADGSWAAGEKLFSYEIATPSDLVSTLTITGGTAVSIERLTATARISRSERNALRFTIDSGALPARGRYRIAVSRQTVETVSDYESDRCVLSAVNEVVADKVGLRRSAWFAVKIRLTDQLSSEPTVTALVKGRKVWRYDVNGNPLTKEWSTNPSDIALDILLSDDWQRPLSPSRIDFPAYLYWRETAAGAGLGFNGVFDFRTTVWDALATVMRAGRASPVVSGTRWSLVMEAPSEPVMMFGDHNILKGSFENSWLGREGRANHIEIQYYDETEGFKRRSVYAIDEEALARGEPIRQATINMIGVTNRAQAQSEADLQLRMNMAISQSCRFKASVDAIGCTVGDVVIVQHNLPKWGWADRVKSVTWPVINLHRAIDPAGSPDTAALAAADSTGATIDMPAGDWRVLVLRPTVQVGSPALINAVSGRQVRLAATISGAVHRAVIAGQDYEVVSKVIVGSETVLTLDRQPGAVVTLQATLWQTDVIVEAPILLPKLYDRKITINTAGWPGGTIAAGDHIMFGRVGKFKKLFRVTEVGHGTSQNRELAVVEYNPWVYNPHTAPSTGSPSEIPSAPLHVLDLSLNQDSESVQGGGVRYGVTCAWRRPLNDLRGHAGSRVYVSIGSEDFRLHETVQDGRETSRIEAPVDTLVRFKVVAFDRDGYLAPFISAPIAALTVSTRRRLPPTPTGLAAAGGKNVISVTWNYPTDPDVKAVEVYESATNNFADAILIDAGLKRFFVRSNLAPVETRYFWIRNMSFAGQFSPLAGPVSATTVMFTAADIQDAILNTAKFASGIAPVGLVAGVPSSRVIDGGRALDVVYDTVTDKIYRWNGTAYTASVPTTDLSGLIADEQIGDLDAAKLTGTIGTTTIADDAISTPKLAAGAITTAKIAAGAITASKLLLADTSNAWPDFDMRDGAMWSSSTGATLNFLGSANPNLGQRLLEIPASTDAESAESAWFQLETGAEYSVSGAAYCSTAATGVTVTLSMELGTLNAAGVVTSTRSVLIGTRTANANTSRFTVDVTTTGSERRARFVLSKNNVDGAGARTSGLIVRRKAGGSLIVDGSISADKIAAGAITAGKIAAGAVSATEIAADAITANKIAANAITAAKLAAANVITLSAQISDGVITNANIGDAQITAAKIGDAQINNAKIGDLQVNTIKIASGAISVSSGGIWTGIIPAGSLVGVGSISTGDPVYPGSYFTQIFIKLPGGEYGREFYIYRATGGTETLLETLNVGDSGNAAFVSYENLGAGYHLWFVRTFGSVPHASAKVIITTSMLKR